MIAHRQGSYTLRKVPAHKDLKWNEVADATAKSAARATPTDNLPVRGPDRPQRENLYRPLHEDTTIESKAQLRPIVREWLARRDNYARGSGSLHHFWTSIEGVDSIA